MLLLLLSSMMLVVVCGLPLLLMMMLTLLPLLLLMMMVVVVVVVVLLLVSRWRPASKRFDGGEAVARAGDQSMYIGVRFFFFPSCCKLPRKGVSCKYIGVYTTAGAAAIFFVAGSCSSCSFQAPPSLFLA